MPNGHAGVIAVIPARGGSKRVPGKNERVLLGRRLIEYTIEAALTSGVFERVVVSTDSESIADISRGAGADVPFIREASLADDQAHVSAVTVDALERLAREGSTYVHVAQLLPNCPLRTAEDLQQSYEHFVLSGADVQISVARYGWQSPWWAMRAGPRGELIPLFQSEATQRSQDLTELVCPTGAVWWARTDALLRERTFHIHGRVGWEMPADRAVDIDTPDDLDLAEALLRHMLVTGGGRVS